MCFLQVFSAGVVLKAPKAILIINFSFLSVDFTEKPQMITAVAFAMITITSVEVLLLNFGLGRHFIMVIIFFSTCLSCCHAHSNVKTATPTLWKNVQILLRFIVCFYRYKALCPRSSFHLENAKNGNTNTYKQFFLFYFPILSISQKDDEISQFPLAEYRVSDSRELEYSILSCFTLNLPFQLMRGKINS